MNRLYLQLGRAGDVLNILPLLKRDFDQTGNRPLMMVQEAFASILEGVNYADPVIWRGKFEDVAGAWREAETVAGVRGAQIVCTQIYGDQMATAESCSSFMRESWAQVPDAPAWGTLPLVFDRRDKDREQAVFEQLTARTTGKPYVLLALSGHSSPFEHGSALIRYLREHIGSEFDLIDISGFLAPRFFDLLTVFERAHCLVTVDSGALHLAHAVPSLPVVAFVTREPSAWHGSPWRRQQVGRFFYDEAPECFEAVPDAITHQDRAQIWHVWSSYSGSEDDERRKEIARASWYAEHAGGGWHAAPQVILRRHSLAIGDTRGMPYVKDLVDDTVRGLCSSRIVALTNADVCFTPGLTGWILDKVPRHGAAFTHRYDFARLNKPLVHEAQVKRGKWYPGSDAFFFTVAWWEAHRHEYPDMILGREHCDEVLRQLIKRHGGVEIKGAIYHERHDSFWESPDQYQSNKGNQHNRKLARQWFLKTGLAPNDPEWWKLPG